MTKKQINLILRFGTIYLVILLLFLILIKAFGNLSDFYGFAQVFIEIISLPIFATGFYFALIEFGKQLAKPRIELWTECINKDNQPMELSDNEISVYRHTSQLQLAGVT